MKIDSTKPKVTVIGAGISGIASAVKLIESGYAVTLIEAKNHIGGRLYSFQDNTTGEIIDNGQHALVGAYVNFLDILKKIGTYDKLNFQKNLKVNFLTQDSKSHIFDSVSYLGSFGAVLGLLKFDLLSLKSKWSFIKFIFKLKSGNKPHANLTCSEWLRSNNQCEDAIEYFWTPFIYATLNQDPEVAAAILLHEVLKRTLLANPEASRLILPSTDLSDLINPFIDWFEGMGGKIILSDQAENIKIEEDKIKSVMLKSGLEIESDHFIFALQPTSLMKLLPDEVKNGKFYSDINLIKYSTIINIYYWFDSTINSDDFYALLGTQGQWLFNRRNIVESDPITSQKYPGHVSITISGANDFIDFDSGELANKCFEELKNAMPQFRNVKILHSKVIKDKRATFLADPITETYRPDNITPIKNMYLAGDWTKTNLPATIEGAVNSGLKCAEIILKNNIMITSN